MVHSNYFYITCENQFDQKRKTLIWAAIRNFYPEFDARKFLLGDKINCAANCLLLQVDYYQRFIAFSVAFEPQDVGYSIIHKTFRLTLYYSQDGSCIKWEWYHSGKSTCVPGIRFVENHPLSKRIDPPHPSLLKIHWSLAMVLNAGGTASALKNLLRDSDENGVLSEDGGDAHLLYGALLQLPSSIVSY